MTVMDRRAFPGRGAAFAGSGLFATAAAETLMKRFALAAGHRDGRSPYGPLYPMYRAPRRGRGHGARNGRGHGYERHDDDGELTLIYESDGGRSTRRTTCA